MRRAGAQGARFACLLGGLVGGLVGCLTACSSDAAGDAADWQRGAGSPLAPRWGAVTAWTGEEALFAGGVLTNPIPPGADVGSDFEYEYAADGAAYDPVEDEWREIAESPETIGYWYRGVLVDGTWVLYGSGEGQHWLAYDIGADAWRVLPQPPRPAKDTGQIAGLDGAVYVPSRDDRVFRLDLAGDTWEVLPESDQGPTIDIAGIVATDDAVLVGGSDPQAADVVTVEIWDGSGWRRLPALEQTALYPWIWTGTRVVSPSIPFEPRDAVGGRLDPVTGDWSPLPLPPDGPRQHTVDGADGPLIGTSGGLYDDRTGEYRTVAGPPGPAPEHRSGLMGGGYALVFGGYDATDGYDDPDGLLDTLWVLDLDELS